MDDEARARRALEIIEEAQRDGHHLYAYGDGSYGLGPAELHAWPAFGREMVANPDLTREVVRQLLTLQGPDNTIPSTHMTAEDVAIYNRQKAGEAWARACAEGEARP